MINLLDYLDAEGLRAMTFEERDKKLEDTLDSETLEKFNELAAAVSNCPHYDNCRNFYKFIAEKDLITLIIAPALSETELLVPFIIEHGVKDKNTIIDVGCGSGSKTIYYALANPNAKITGIDFSQPLLDIAKKTAEKYNVQIDFVYADLVNMEICKELDGKQFDSVICTNMIGEGGVLLCAGNTFYLELLDEKAKTLAALTANDGQLILNCNPSNPVEFKDILYSHLKDVGFKNIDYKFIKYIYPNELQEEAVNLTLICKK